MKVEARERNAAHRLIEAFMILANETVARFLEGKGLPCLFRVHEKPSEEKASAFAAYLRGLGVPVRFSAENVRPSDYAEVLSSAEGSGARTVVNRVMLRSMMKARYCEENFGISASLPNVTAISLRPSAAIPTSSCTASSRRRCTAGKRKRKSSRPS